MGKKLLVIISTLIILGVVALIVQAALQPKPFRWEPGYRSYDKQPLGGKIIIELLPGFFPNVERFHADDMENYYSAYQTHKFLTIDDEGNYDSALYLAKLDTSQRKVYNLFGMADRFVMDNEEANALLLHLYQGNHALIVANSISSGLADFTGVYTGLEAFNDTQADSVAEKFTLTSAYVGQELTIKPYKELWSIINFPDSAEVVLENTMGDVLGIRLSVGEGSLTFVSLPLLFSNYYILKQNRHLAEALLLELPERDTRWTNQMVGPYRYKESRSLLDFIHQEEALRWAFYTLIVSLLVYFLFQIKRTQRPIAFITPPKNVSLQFTEALAGLYVMQHDHKDMLDKKMTYFLEMIRHKYNLDTHEVDTRFFHRLAVKSGVDEGLVHHLFRRYELLSAQARVSKQEFLVFNQLLQKFKVK